MKGIIIVKMKVSKKISEKELKKRLKKFKKENKDMFDWVEYSNYVGDHPLVI